MEAFTEAKLPRYSLHKISKASKEQAGLSTFMVVNTYEMEEPEEMDDELASIAVGITALEKMS